MVMFILKQWERKMKCVVCKCEMGIVSQTDDVCEDLYYCDIVECKNYKLVQVRNDRQR